MMAR
ncbi:hypothetical protein E2C01_094235 [Portunus trituberculatus]|jgi:hypothetical protein